MLKDTQGPSSAAPSRRPTSGSRVDQGGKIPSPSRPITRRCEQRNQEAAPINPASISGMPRSDKIAASISKRKKKSRSRRRHTSSSHRPDFADTTAVGSDALRWNSDLEHLMARIDGHEQRMSKQLQTAHDQMAASVAHMFECLFLRLKEHAERERTKIEQIRKERGLRKAAEYHLQSL